MDALACADSWTDNAKTMTDCIIGKDIISIYPYYSTIDWLQKTKVIHVDLFQG